MEVREGKAPEPAKPTIEAPLQGSSKLIFRIFCILYSFIITLSKTLENIWKTSVRHICKSSMVFHTFVLHVWVGTLELFLPSAM